MGHLACIAKFAAVDRSNRNVMTRPRAGGRPMRPMLPHRMILASSLSMTAKRSPSTHANWSGRGLQGYGAIGRRLLWNVPAVCHRLRDYAGCCSRPDENPADPRPLERWHGASTPNYLPPQRSPKSFIGGEPAFPGTVNGGLQNRSNQCPLDTS